MIGTDENWIIDLGALDDCRHSDETAEQIVKSWSTDKTIVVAKIWRGIAVVTEQIWAEDFVTI